MSVYRIPVSGLVKTYSASPALVAQFQQSFVHDWLHWHGTISVGFCFREIDGVEVKIYV